MAIGEKLGHNLKGGEAIELVSDLGGGKTSLVKGIAKGLGSKDKVHSPSFTISNEYVAGDISLHHFDFYRLTEAGIMNDELAELVNDPKCVVVVEWGDIVNDVLPEKRLTITMLATDEEERSLKLEYPDELNYLVWGL